MSLVQAFTITCLSANKILHHVLSLRTVLRLMTSKFCLLQNDIEFQVRNRMENFVFFKNRLNEMQFNQSSWLKFNLGHATDKTRICTTKNQFIPYFIYFKKSYTTEKTTSSNIQNILLDCLYQTVNLHEPRVLHTCLHVLKIDMPCLSVQPRQFKNL